MMKKKEIKFLTNACMFVLLIAGLSCTEDESPLVNVLVSEIHFLNSAPNSAGQDKIVVGALNALGVKASYSSTGSNLWVSAPGGEDGCLEPAILTTDQSSCELGYSRKDLDVPSCSPFNKGNSDNPNCNYTPRFNGTSSAAPMVSGVVALMLQANPKLGWRDVRHILASTANQVDPNSKNFSRELVFGDFKYGYTEPGWVENAAGFHFHDWYGFGRVNAGKAVEMALEYSSFLGKLNQSVTHNTSNYCKDFEFCSRDTWNFDSGVLSKDIPDDESWVSHTISVSVQWVVESIQIRLSATHQEPGDLTVELVSPSGTKSLILHPCLAVVGSNLNDVVLLTNAFYGESSQGNWTLRMSDRITGYNGILTNWKINVLGHNSQ